MAYWAISEKKYKEAYQISLHHGFTRGTEFAEAEFLAGWLALSKMNDPDRALRHFTRLRDGVGSPISLSRAHYWVGRAHKASNTGQEIAHFISAAQYPNTYYGMLAGDEIEGTSHRVNLPPEFVSLAEDYGFMRPSLRAAKQAGRFQGMLTESGYPMVASIDALPKRDFEEAFVYAIARQESEFATNAVSSAKAYGMMQMINSTAKATARKHRIKYDLNRLATDGDYAAIQMWMSLIGLKKSHSLKQEITSCALWKTCKSIERVSITIRQKIASCRTYGSVSNLFNRGRLSS